MPREEPELLVVSVRRAELCMRERADRLALLDRERFDRLPILLGHAQGAESRRRIVLLRMILVVEVERAAQGARRRCYRSSSFWCELCSPAVSNGSPRRPRPRSAGATPYRESVDSRARSSTQDRSSPCASRSERERHRRPDCTSGVGIVRVCARLLPGERPRHALQGRATLLATNFFLLSGLLIRPRKKAPAKLAIIPSTAVRTLDPV